MKNSVKFLTIALAAFAIGFTANNYAISDIPANFKVATVDIQEVVASSAQVQDLKKEQQLKTDELVKFVEKARKDVSMQKDEAKKKSLEEKYSKELQAKREKMEKDYIEKLQKIDESISNTVKAQAKLGNYDLVLAKGVVLSGGEDITPLVINVVKQPTTKPKANTTTKKRRK